MTDSFDSDINPASPGDGATAGSSGERLAAARDKFGDVVDRKVRGIRDGAGRASDSFKETAQRASATARDTVDSARETVRHGYDRVSKDFEQLSEDVNDYVRHHPGKSVAIAVGVGFVLGILLRGRRD